MRKALIVALFLAAGICRIPANETSQNAWILGIAEIPGASLSSLSPAEQSALSSLLAMILDKIKDIEQRLVPEDEEKMRMERERLASLYSEGAEAAALREKRDSAALSPSQLHKRASEERTLAYEYFKKQKREGSFKTSDAPDTLTIVKVNLWSRHNSGEFIPDSTDPAYVCVREKLDYLIRWEIAEIDSFFRIRMESWNAALCRSDFSYTTYCPRDDVSAVADELAYAITLASLAQPSAYIVLSVEPLDARVFVDERQLASGSKRLRVYEEREYKISAEATGYRKAEITVKPVFGKSSEIALKLEPVRETEALVMSNPEGASLYLDGIWIGTTPASIPLVGMPRVALLQYPGYEDLFEVVNPDKNAELSFTLEKLNEGASSFFTKRKENFYHALGLLVVSLPVSIVTYGLYNQNAMLYLEDPGNAVFSRRNDITFGCFVATAGISGALFVNATIQLIRYVRSAR